MLFREATVKDISLMKLVRNSDNEIRPNDLFIVTNANVKDYFKKRERMGMPPELKYLLYNSQHQGK